eukprot:COSAG06_NODE_146_length_22145_cov_11.714733_20_plen_88_part_00
MIVLFGPLSADSQRIVFSHIPDCEKMLSVLELFLCLSRVCLGKMIIYAFEKGGDGFLILILTCFSASVMFLTPWSSECSAEPYPALR